jgi:hypothetical protein
MRHRAAPLGFIACLMLTASDARSQTYRSADSTPVLRIGGVRPDGALLFAGVTGAVRLSDGTVAVADHLTSTVHFFDAKGVHLGHVGRDGDGPGEFRHIMFVGECGAGRAHVWDMAGSRVTVLGSDRRLIRQFTLPSRRDSPADVLDVRCSRDGTYAFIAPARVSSQTVVDGTVHYLFDLAIADTTGVVIANVPRLIVREFVRVRSAYMPKPLSPPGSFAIGRQRVFVQGRELGTIEVRALDGRPLATLRPRVERRTPTRRHLEVAAAEIAGIVLPSLREQTHSQLLELPLPEGLPPFGDLFVDPDGVFWIVISTPGDSRTRWRHSHPMAGRSDPWSCRRQ